MNHATLVDSMLRDWKLPVARSQGAFDYWRKERRVPVWRKIDRALKKAGVAPSAIDGEQIVFSVRVSGNELVIRPVHILDLGRAVLVVDPKAGVTRVVDTWSERSPSLLEVKGSVTDYVRQLAADAVSAAKQGDVNSGREKLIRALSTQPATAFREIEQSWARLFRYDSSLRAQLAPKIKEIALQQERLAVIDELQQSPEIKEDDKVFVQRLSEAVEADPGLPVDLHLALAVRIAGTLSELSKMLSDRGEPGRPNTGWQIIESAATEAGAETDSPDRSASYKQLWKTLNLPQPKDSSPELLKEASRAFERYYDVNPDKALRNSIATIQSREPGYLREALRRKDMPKEPSGEMRALLKGHEVQIAEWDAAEMDGVQNQLTQRMHAERAAAMLWSDKTANSSSVREELLKAARKDSGGTIPAFKSACERLDGFTKGKQKPDTLARVEIAQTIELGAKELLFRAKQRVKNPKTEYATLLSTHARLLARLRFEENSYAPAYDTLFGNSVPVALAYPKLSWKVGIDAVGLAGSRRAPV